MIIVSCPQEGDFKFNKNSVGIPLEVRWFIPKSSVYFTVAREVAALAG
jgi:hypothetical protein